MKTHHVIPVIHTDGYYQITYYDSEWLNTSCPAGVINASSVQRIVGHVNGFLRLYNLHGITNGRLLIITGPDLVELIIEVVYNVLHPEGFVSQKDFIVLAQKEPLNQGQYQRLCHDSGVIYDIDNVKSYITDLINKNESTWLRRKLDSKGGYDVSFVP